MIIDEHFHIYAISKDQKCQHVRICNKFSFLYHPQIPRPLLPALLGVQLLHLNLIQLGNLSPPGSYPGTQPAENRTQPSAHENQPLPPAYEEVAVEQPSAPGVSMSRRAAFQ